ncbi:ABC transporter ATP-binding protein [Megasphaera sp. AM44-1BH]|jgi:peptide/nickel transport system ATP-binding protein/oligopeptide transport system ATP-binding protein|uniref:ABC transporter ATP-binding protein n=1 Tax=Megasphaera sp. AM44-1BH TaxID=2292358 RepID=UPI000E49123D|nr:oligopeptide/dipeptide ABC transporter ATP-binding protein [Megasphaera sp. AM44-1BH]RHA15799.1 ATP-binding cassette domain-containing protein [Megasphaera sp. AM44-1BH]
MALIDVHHLTKQFIVRTDWLGRPRTVLTAVHDVSLTIHSGETVGLVGESGCGKSTFARTVLGLYKKTSGTVLFKGKDVENPDTADAFHRQVQMIFQDPYASLDPRMTVEDIIGEPLRNYGICSSPSQLRQRVAQLLDEVDLTREAAQRYPHEFSGGQRQRVGIARALALEPDCIFCDEPISALDVSVQVQIVNMLQRLQKERNLAYLFIAHDLAMVHHLSRRIGVMYLGRLVELGDGDAVYHRPLHPYTQALIAAVPVPDPHCRRQVCLSGEVPSPLDPPAGCVFHPRCPLADERCRSEVPVLRDMGAGRMAACHHAGKEAL